MSFLLESDPNRLTVRALVLRGTIALVVAVLLVAGILAKMNGAFDKSYHVTAALTDVATAYLRDPMSSSGVSWSGR